MGQSCVLIKEKGIHAIATLFGNPKTPSSQCLSAHGWWEAPLSTQSENSPGIGFADRPHSIPSRFESLHFIICTTREFDHCECAFQFYVTGPVRAWSAEERVWGWLASRPLPLIGVGGSIGGEAGCREGLWAVGWLAPFPNGVRRANMGPVAWGRDHGWLASQPCPWS